MKLKQILHDCLTQEELALLVRGYDVIGDIAVTIIPPQLEQCQDEIAKAILSTNRNIKVVAKRAGLHSGQHRIMPLTIIAGEQRKETLHREYGVKLYLNLEKVYFSPRSGTERKRIADLVRPAEDVLVLFSGIAPFPLVIARHSKARSITGIEINRDAHTYACRNVVANNCSENVTLYHNDVATKTQELARCFDRVIMPLPKSAGAYLAAALAVLKQGGWLHFYDFKPRQSSRETQLQFKEQCARHGRSVIQSSFHLCGHNTPETYRVCIDAQLQ